jgi:hypothetical protein
LQERDFRNERYPAATFQRRTTVKVTLLSATVAAFGIAAIATPALADFWIVREGSTGKCMMVDRKPTDSKIIIVGGNGKVCTTRADAEKELTVV